MARTRPPQPAYLPICGANAAYPRCVKRVKLTWLAAIAVFALSAAALTAAAASAAEPEWGHCVSVKSKGHYEDSNCSKEAFTENKKHVKKYKGKFEWDPGAAAVCFAEKHGKYKDAACTEEDLKKGEPKGKYEKTGGPKFTGEGGAGVLHARIRKCEIEEEGVKGLEGKQLPREDCSGAGNPEYDPNGEGFGGANNLAVECASEHATGEATGSDEVGNVSVSFKGCTSFGFPAQTHGLPAGEIQTDSLKGRLGYISKATHEVGVLLEPSTAGGEFAEFEALEGDILEHVGVGNATAGAAYEETGPGNPTGHDGVMSPITPVGQMTHTFTQNYRAEEDQQPCPQAMCQKPELPSWINVPSRFEGGQLEALETFFKVPVDTPEFTTEWSPAAEEVTNVNTVEGNAEIKG